MTTKKTDEEVKPQVVIRDEHDDATRRTWLGVQTVNGALLPVTVSGNKFYRFLNQGGMLTWVAVRNAGTKEAWAKVSSLTGERDLTAVIQVNDYALFGPFAVDYFNRADHSVWLDVSDPKLIVSVHRLGV